MAHSKLVLALGIIAAASPVSAASQDRARMAAAPAGAPDIRYCMRAAAIAGRRIEQIACWTREKWAEQGVDVDDDWPEKASAR